MKDMRRGFLEEARELNEAIYRTTKSVRNEIAKGREPVRETQELFRIFHTLKGLAGMNEFARLSRFAHTVEDTLDAVRKGQIAFSVELVGQLVLCTEIIDHYLASVSSIGEDAIDGETQAELVARLEHLSRTETAPDRTWAHTLPDAIVSQLNDIELARLQAGLRNGKPIFLVRTTYNFETFDRDMKNNQEAVNAHGEWVATLPGEEPADEQSISFDILLAWVGNKASLKNCFPDSTTLKMLHAGSTDEQNNLETPEATEPSEPDIGEKTGAATGESVRVPLPELDALVRSMEDLMLIRNQLKRDLVELVQSAHTQIQVEQVHFQLDRLGEHIAALQKRIVQFRMVPLETLFRPLESAVMRTADALGREVHIRFSGAHVRIDKWITDRLQDPLIHMLRNAVDHGIKAPEIRKEQGKNATGAITLNASQQGNSVHIEISDDGAGLDLDQIRKQAEQKGLFSKDQTISDSEIMGVIFQPGFSTAEAVSETSGRGVGLDAVRDDVNRLGGTIQVRSNPGEGTVFLLQIPITRAILPVCFVRSGETVLAIPLLFVTEVQPYRESETAWVGDRLFYQIADGSLPAIQLPMLLNTADLMTESRILLKIAHTGQPFCLIVEDILGQREVTMTPFSGKPARIPLISGVCNYSADALGYVLDIPQLSALVGGFHE